MLLLKESEDCLFLLLTMLIMVLRKLKETVTQNIFLPRVNIANYNVLIDGKNFYDQQINDLAKQDDKIKKTATGQGEDYTTRCLLDYQYFKDHYNLTAVDLSKQKGLDAN